MAHTAVQAANVGAVDRLQRRAAGQQRQQLLAQRRTGVALGVEHRHAALRRQRHLVLEPLHQAVAAALEGLHPDPTFLAQPQRQAGRRQLPIGRVGIHGLQPRGDGAGRGHRPLQGGPLAWRDLELEFGLEHAPPRAQRVPDIVSRGSSATALATTLPAASKVTLKSLDSWPWSLKRQSQTSSCLSA